MIETTIKLERNGLVGGSPWLPMGNACSFLMRTVPAMLAIAFNVVVNVWRGLVGGVNGSVCFL